jgi:hypothetical protein
MKKIIVSVGLAVAGTASLQAAYAPDMGSDASKMWSISGTLRGFYDNNYTTGNTSRGSFGFEVSPQIEINVPLQQTEFGARYIYGLYYYQDRQELDQNPIDQTHQLDLWMDHAFTENWQGRVQDSFVVAQEPQLLDPSNPTSFPARANGNNIANTGTVSLHTDWTRLFSTDLSYQNKFYDYQQSGETVLGLVLGTPPSLAGTLNRIEHYVTLDFGWHATPTTTFLFGYIYGQVNYTGNEPIALAAGPDPLRFSDSRDNRSHTGYVGVKSQLLANLSVAANVGVQYTDDYNDPSGNTSFGPYADASLTYTYLPGSYAQLGITHTRNATDEIDLNTTTGSIALDQESTLVYGSINHKVTPKLLATLIGTYENSAFNGGSFNNESDDLYSVGLNFNYTFTRHFSGEVGYNYDDLNSNIPERSYSRDRVYVGVTATY